MSDPVQTDWEALANLAANVAMQLLVAAAKAENRGFQGAAVASRNAIHALDEVASQFRKIPRE